MTSVPQSPETVTIFRSSLLLLVDVRRWQLSYRVRRDGPKIPRLRLKEVDLDASLAKLPHEGNAAEIREVPQALISAVLDMRRLQREALKLKDSETNEREMRNAQRKVDEMLAEAGYPVDPHQVALPVGRATDEEESEAPYWAGLD